MYRIGLALFAAACVACAAEGQDANRPASEKEANTKAGPRAERSTDKDGKVTELTRDDRGNVIIRKLNVGTLQEAIWLYTYSQTNQLLSEQAPDGTRTLYDYAGPDSKTPRRVKVIKPDGTETERSLGCRWVKQRLESRLGGADCCGTA